MRRYLNVLIRAFVNEHRSGAVLVFCCLGLFPAAAAGQSAQTCGANPAVWGVSTEGRRLTTTNARPRAYIEDYITIGVCQLESLLHAAREQHVDVTLFMNGLDLGIAPSRINQDVGSLTYTLDRTRANAAIWNPVLYDPFFEESEVVFVSVGPAGGVPLPRVEHAAMEIEFRKLWVDWTTWLWFLFLLAVSVGTVWFAVKTDMLREGPATGGIRQPYSLGRVQMATWFVLIVVGYIAIWVVTGDRDTLTPSLLALAGISAATGLTAAVVTPRSIVRAEALRNRITEEIAALDTSLAQLQTDITGLGERPQAAVAKRLLDARQQARDKLALELATVPAVFASRGFLSDLITDDRGSVALDRVQIVVWTAVLIGLFLYSVTFYVVMPEFSATMLGLMGISSGTYIGFKLPAVK